MDNVKKHINCMAISWCIYSCYELKFLESDNRTTLVLSNTRELDKELFYKLVYLI